MRSFQPAVIATICFYSASFSVARGDTLSLDDMWTRPLGTTTLSYLTDNSLTLSDGRVLGVEDESAYSVATTTKDATAPNVFARSEYDAETDTVTTTNYEITIDPYFAFSGENAVSFDVLNGGTFTTNYDVVGSRAALGSGKVATQWVKTVAGMSTNKYGGVFTNQGTLGLFGGTFINNHAESYGGSVLFNFRAKINDIAGSFIGNTTSATSGVQALGGAILNYGGTIGNIAGYFMGNTSPNFGGAVSVMGDNSVGRASVDILLGDFIGNKSANGGAVLVLQSDVGNIIGDFIGNTATDGAGVYVANRSTVGDIVGDFIGNTATTRGGGIYVNTSTIDNIVGNFSGNVGASIYNHNESLIKNISGNFTDNPSAAIWNNWDSSIGNIEGNFINNSAVAGGAAIHNTSATIGSVKGVFVNNTTKNNAGAIFNGAEIMFGGGPTTMPQIDSIEGIFIGNSGNFGTTGEGGAHEGGAIGNAGIIGTVKGTFKDNFVYGVTAHGGAITNGYVLDKIENSTFTGNYARNNTEGYKGYGGAIYTSRDLYLESNDGFDFYFKDNYVQSADGDKDYQAIYISRHSDVAHTLTMNAKEDAKFTLYDGVQGDEGYASLVLQSTDATGTMDFYSYIAGVDTTIDGATVNLMYADEKINDWVQKSLNVNSGKLNLALDLNASDGTSDTLTFTDKSDGVINISDIKFMDAAGAGDTVIYRVLNVADGNLRLALDTNRYDTGETKVKTVYDEVGTNVTVVANNQFKQYEVEGDVYNTVELATSDGGTTNDSLSVTYGLIDWSEDATENGSMGDTLKLWAENNETADKVFDISSMATDYVVADSEIDTIVLSGNDVVIKGSESGSGINLDNAMLSVNESTELEIKNVTLSGDADALLTIAENGRVVLSDSDVLGTVVNNGAYVIDKDVLDTGIAGAGTTPLQMI